MAELYLRTATRSQGNNRALKDGTVTPEGVVSDFEEIPVLVQGFRRMVRGLEFDVCEMAERPIWSPRRTACALSPSRPPSSAGSTTRRSRSIPGTA